MDDLYLATVSSRAANPKVVKSLTHVLVPTIVRLINQVSQPIETRSLQTTRLEEEQTEEKQEEQTEDKPIEETEEEQVEDPVPAPAEEELQVESSYEPHPTFEPIPPKTPVNQLMVEKLSGMLVPVDTVRIDGEVIEKWNEIYDGKEIKMVNIEALDGKKTICKFKPTKEAKSNSKGIIQIPEKILQALQTEKGKLVMVKPLVN